jgi:hypothetical protein
MGLDMYLLDKSDKLISGVLDEYQYIARIFLKSSSPELGRIPVYGATTNLAQEDLQGLENELESILKEMPQSIERRYLSALLRLIKKSSEYPHSYLQFIGD